MRSILFVVAAFISLPVFAQSYSINGNGRGGYQGSGIGWSYRAEPNLFGGHNIYRNGSAMPSASTQSSFHGYRTYTNHGTYTSTPNLNGGYDTYNSNGVTPDRHRGR